MNKRYGAALSVALALFLGSLAYAESPLVGPQQPAPAAQAKTAKPIKAAPATAKKGHAKPKAAVHVASGTIVTVDTPKKGEERLVVKTGKRRLSFELPTALLSRLSKEVALKPGQSVSIRYKKQGKANIVLSIKQA